MSFKHVAVIMDGNGRWANQRFRPRIWGHVRGSEVVSEIVEEADNLGVKCLTLYAFSTENWSRPLEEVSSLFKLLKKFLIKERERILLNRIRFRVIGDLSKLPGDIVDLIQKLTVETRDNQGLNLTFAFNYGGRQEILKSVNDFILTNPGKLITEKDLSHSLYCPELGDVDLLIRTGGEHRVSNFLLWQIAYSELFFTPTKWPDFTPREFREILEATSMRERRFGGVKSQLNFSNSKMNAQKNCQTFIEGFQ